MYDGFICEQCKSTVRHKIFDKINIINARTWTKEPCKQQLFAYDA